MSTQHWMSAARPLLVSAIAGAALAWPTDARMAPYRSIAAVVLGAGLALGEADGGRELPTWRRAQSSVCVAVLATLAMAQRPEEPGFGLVVLIGATLTILQVWKRLEASRNDAPARSVTIPAVVLAGLAVGVADHVGVPRSAVVGALALVALAKILADRQQHPIRAPDFVEGLMASSAKLLVPIFAVIALLGTLALSLPSASAGPGAISPVDAAFTAVSAACVTGLIVLDTPNDFSGFGQLVILVLIQVGGLGIMTFASTATVILGRRLGMREEAIAAEMMGGHAARRDIESALRTVLRVTVASEATGAALLVPLFLVHGDPPATALWRGLFTSVSAFCNAGFALQSDSLTPYASSPLVLLVVSVLIVVGGLGPLVVGAFVVATSRRITLHARLTAATTAALLVVPMVMLLALEWSNTLSGMGLVDKLVNAWFQSATLRTAGFNSVDIGAIRPATWTLMILCMFIGGSPGSTAGGVKTTTVAVLMLAVVAAIRGRQEAEVFGRRIPHRTVYEAAAITTIGVLSAVAGLAALQVTQSLELDTALFEIVSALGTVGLSMGATAQLDDVGKVLLIGAMFAGRVGPLTLFIFLMGRRRPARRYPMEAVQVG